MKKHLLSLAALACAGMFMNAAADAGSDTGGTGTGTPPAPPSPQPPAAPPVKLTKVRVLLDCVHGKCNDVVALPPAVAKEAAAAGQVDPDKDAVKYAETLEQNQPKASAG